MTSRKKQRPLSLVPGKYVVSKDEECKSNPVKGQVRLLPMDVVLVSGWAWGRATHWMTMILAWRTAAGKVSMQLRSPGGCKPCSG